MGRLVKRLALSGAVLALLVLGAELYLRSKHYGAIPSVWFDPAIGTRFHPSQSRQIYGPRMVFLSDARINAQGFRGADFDAPGVQRERRIACLGDSFTFGWGVEDAESWPERLQVGLDSGPLRGTWQVLNCGLPGYNTWQQLRLYERVVRHEDPDIVVIGWFLNDLDPYSIGATGALAPQGHLLAGTALLDWYTRKLRRTRPNYTFEGLDVDAAKELKPFYDQNTAIVEHNAGDPRSRPYVARNFGHLGQLCDAILADGAQPVLLVFPSVGQVDALVEHRASLPEEEYRARRAVVARIQTDLAEFAQGRGLPFVDLLDSYMDSEIRPYGNVDLSHPSVHGQQIAADAVLAALESAGLLR